MHGRNKSKFNFAKGGPSFVNVLAQVVASVFMSNSACHRETVESTTTVISTTTTTATLPSKIIVFIVLLIVMCFSRFDPDRP